MTGRNQDGFHFIILPILVVVLAAVGFAGWYVYRVTHNTKSTGAQAEVVSVTDADNGKTITLHPNDNLTLTLSSTYWTIAGSSNTHVVNMTGDPATIPSGNCVPGGGCGTVVAHFHALRAGSATITASRTTCGEALACTGGMGNFSVNIVVH